MEGSLQRTGSEHAPDVARVGFYVACVLFAGWLLWRAGHPSYAFEVDDINKAMGRWSLRFLFLCLILSPISRWAHAPALRRWRRPLGLAAFGYAALHTGHFLVYGRVWPHRLSMFAERPYWVIGLAALILFIPLAATSNDWVVRRMNPRHWRRLHFLVYPAAALSVVHEVMAYSPLAGEAGVYSAFCVVLCVVKAIDLAARARWPDRKRGQPSQRVAR